MGFDLNRHWHEPSPWAHPTLYATKNLLMEMDASEVNLRFPRLLLFRYPLLYLFGNRIIFVQHGHAAPYYLEKKIAESIMSSIYALKIHENYA